MQNQLFAKAWPSQKHRSDIQREKTKARYKSKKKKKKKRSKM